MARVLIADDSIIMRKNLKSILTEAGHTVVAEASNGIQAYSEYEKFTPDLVTMDITMPILDGLQAVKKIIRSFPDAKIIMISAFDQKNMVFQALETGAKHYIMKPITPEKVLSVVNEVLQYDRLKNYSKELGSKNQALSYMWHEIKDSKEEILEISKNTEEIVEERTAELENTNRRLKEALENLKKTEQKLILSEKSAALTNLVAGMAHEINTPIGICVTAVSFLQEKNSELNDLYMSGTMKKSDFEKYLNLITETTNSTLLNLNRASNLIRSFKLVAVDQSNEEKRTFNMKHYIEDILLTLKPELKKRKHEIKLNCAEDFIVNSYPGTISQIMTNLVMNSLIHGYDEGEKVTLSFNITKGNNHILFEYTDDGKGIKKEIQGKIFDAFFTTKRGNGGTGLGLHIVYNLVTQTLGGTINCESEENMGTAFTITIPLEK